MEKSQFLKIWHQAYTQQGGDKSILRQWKQVQVRTQESVIMRKGQEAGTTGRWKVKEEERCWQVKVNIQHEKVIMGWKVDEMMRINPVVVDRDSASGSQDWRFNKDSVLNGVKEVLDYLEMVHFSTSVDTQTKRASTRSPVRPALKSNQ